MLRRTATLAAATLLLSMSVGSATSSGSFGGVNLEAVAVGIEHCPGTAQLESATDGILSLGTVLLSPVTVDTVQLSDLDERCEDLVPKVVVIGNTLSDSTERVLGVLELPPIGSGSTQSLLAVDPLPLSVGTFVSEVRIAYLPD